MTSVPRALGTPDALELLDRAVGYTRGCLALVRPAHLDRPTPCVRWSLRALLRHMDDSLAAMGEAAVVSSVALAPAPGPAGGDELLSSIRQRACTLVGQWAVPPPGADQLVLGSAMLARETLGAVGALEITLHGWDVAQACGSPRPIPQGLAQDLWGVAHDHIVDADRPQRFGPVVELPSGAGPQQQLLALAGRRG